MTSSPAIPQIESIKPSVTRKEHPTHPQQQKKNESIILHHRNCPSNSNPSSARPTKATGAQFSIHKAVQCGARACGSHGRSIPEERQIIGPRNKFISMPPETVHPVCLLGGVLKKSRGVRERATMKRAKRILMGPFDAISPPKQQPLYSYGAMWGECMRQHYNGGRTMGAYCA